MGRVYLAEDRLADSRSVALKIYPSRFFDERLRTEFLALRHLHHPSISRAYDFGRSETDGAPFFTLEYVSGDPLTRVTPTNLTEAWLQRALSLFVRVSGALAYLHRRGVLHLDVKPDNVLVRGQGDSAIPVLIDFGLVRAIASTETSLGMATLPYAAPEMFTGAQPAPAVDIYGLGATFYRVFSGADAISGRDLSSYARSHREHSPAPIENIPTEVDKVIRRSLAKDPRHRPDADELHRQLTEIARKLGTPSSTRVFFHEPDFVGRRKELRTFRRWLDADRKAQPVFQLAGGAGWGKTRLLDEIETIVQTDGKQSLRLQCDSRGSLGLLIDSLEKLEYLSPHRPKSAANKKLLRDVRQALNTAGPSVRDLESLAKRCAQGLLPLLTSNTFLIVDDVHLAADSAHAWIAALTSAWPEASKTTPAPGQPIDDVLAHRPRTTAAVRSGGGIILSLRADAGTAAPPWIDEGLARQVTLGPLSQKEALSIQLEGLDSSLARISTSRSTRLKRELYHRVGGHPLFYVRGLLDLAGDPEGAERLAPLDSIVARLAEIEGLEKRITLVLAQARESFSHRELAALAGVSARRLEPALINLRGAAALSVAPRHIRLVHEKIGEALLRSLTSLERQQLNLELASRYEDLATSDSAPHWLLEATRCAIDAEDIDLAASFAARWTELRVAVPESRRRRSADILLDCADRLAKNRRQSSRAMERVDELREAAADVLEAHGRFDEALRLLSKERAEKAPPTLRRLRRLGALEMRIGRGEKAQKLLSGALRKAVTAHDITEVVHCRSELSLHHHFRGDAAEALEHADAGVDAWRELPAPERDQLLHLAIRMHGILGQVHIRALRFGEAIGRLQEGLALARSQQSQANVSMLLNNLALSHHLDGRFDEALATFAEAERLARSSGDAAALTTIRANVVQIQAKKGHFSTAEAMLEELERSAPVRQSKRMQLACVYTRGLLSNLLQRPAEATWKDVEAVAQATEDNFLRGFSALYRIESLLDQGQLAAAYRSLSRAARSRGHSSALRAVVDARAAYLDGLLGRAGTSRSRREAVRGEVEELPRMLAAWSRLYLALAAVETSDFDAAERELAAARSVFDAVGHSSGKTEVDIANADLLLRRGASDTRSRRSLATLLRRIRASLATLAPTAPLYLGVRLGFLEARELLSRLSDRRRSDAPSEAEAAVDTHLEDEPSELHQLTDILLRLEGDPLVGDHPTLAIQLDVLRAACERASGHPGRAISLGDRVLEALRTTAETLPKTHRRAYASRDPWDRLGLSHFAPPSGEPILSREQTEVLRALLRQLAAMQLTDAQVLERAAPALGATSLVWSHNGQNTCWNSSPPPKTRSAPRKPLVEHTLKIALQQRTRKAVLTARRTAPFSARDASFLESVASALALRTNTSSESSTLRDAPTATISGRSDAADGATESHRPTHLTPATRNLKSTGKTRRLGADGVVCAGRALRRVADVAAELAESDLPVLITGESGVGKNVVARWLHVLGARQDGPYLSQNASALPLDLFEADLFGYEEGAFTGAERARTGFLFRATGGTFHLEEVGDLALEAQKRLLRVVDEKVVRPLGASHPRPLDVRFVASTHRDLEALVRLGEFREDLYFRLNASRIHVPPLRERLEEIPPLAHHFWSEFTGDRSRFPASTIEALQNHSWPGNIRELSSVLRRLSLRVSGPPSASDVETVVGKAKTTGPFSPTLFDMHRFKDLERWLEEGYLEHLLRKFDGDLERIATAVGTSTRSVYRRFERLGLKPKALRESARRDESS